MNNGEYFFIETEEELKQVYGLFGDEFHYSLEEEVCDFLSDSRYRLIGKYNGRIYLETINKASHYGKQILSPLKKSTISNPIKDNRIVSDHTFALRFRRFLDGVTVADACSEEELEYMKRVATKLLTYQYQTATDFRELGYIARTDFEKYLEEGLTTEDGYTFYKGDNVKLFSCMLQPRKEDDNSLMFSVNRILEGGINPNRLFFKEEQNRDKYIEDNLIRYSKKDLERLINEKNN